MPRRNPAPPPQDGLLDLLGAPEPAPRVEKPDPLWGALGVTWGKPPAGRHLCQDCVDLIHGKEGGTHPLVATYRRKGPNGDRLLCPAHAQDHKDADAKVEREHADRIKAAKAAQKAAAGAAGRAKHREHA
jgi:hypothetical protein